MMAIALLALAAPPTPTVDLRPVDGELLELGRPMELVLEFRHAGPEVAVWPDTLSLPEDVELIHRRVERTRDGDQVVDRLVMGLRPFVPGPVEIPAFSVRLGPEQTDVGPIRFHVRSPLPESLEHAMTSTRVSPELRPQLEAMMAPSASPPVAAEWNRPLLGALLGSGGLLVIGGAGGLFLWRRRRRRSAPAAPVDAREEALQALTELGRAIRARPEAMRAHHEALSRILRRLVGLPEARQAEALDRAELSAALRASEARDRLIAILANADLVKFARWPATVEEAEETLARAKQWVEEDAPQLAFVRPRPVSRRSAPAAWTEAGETPPRSPGFDEGAER